MDGVIVVNKPLGKTSHDIVAFLRRLTGIRRIGHTGTLDPAATGVLPVCIGKATKAADMLTASDKAYRAQIVLGMTTDTLDADGEILTECAVTCTEWEIRQMIADFVGEIEQIPPMYSAVKQNGRKLYELARQGIAVERKRRTVHIERIDICAMDMREYTVTVDVYCSKGTYIRTLADDIGMKLGCGAYINTLERTKSGRFTVQDSYTVQELAELAEQGRLEEILVPVDALFNEYAQIVLDSAEAEKVKNGVRIRCVGMEEGCVYRVYDQNKNFLCISETQNGQLVLKKSFW